MLFTPDDIVFAFVKGFHRLLVALLRRRNAKRRIHHAPPVVTLAAANRDPERVVHSGRQSVVLVMPGRKIHIFQLRLNVVIIAQRTDRIQRGVSDLVKVFCNGLLGKGL